MIKKIIRDFGHYIKIINFKKKWRKQNKENFTEAVNIFPIDKVHVGKYTYGNLKIKYYRNEDERLEIGNFCSIADDVVFLLGGNHNYNKISTYPFKNKFSQNKEFEAETKGPIIIEDDVWIGFGATILSGVRIGKGSIIGANSIVTKNVLPYSIYVGNKVIKYRFSKKVIDKLKNLKFENLTEEKIIKNMEYLYKDIDENNVDKIINELNK